MTRSRKPREKVTGRFFTWALQKRGPIFYADGRGNALKLGRFSLGSSDRSVALRNLVELDASIAVRVGLLPPNELHAPTQRDDRLSLVDGRRLYDAHASRPRIADGVRPATQKRYRAVFDKFLPFAEGIGLHYWNQVNKGALEKYAKFLDEQDYAHATQYLELSTIKQVCKWLIEENHLPESCRFRFKVSKNSESTRYCWKEEEFRAIVAHCWNNQSLTWLGNLCHTLGFTGMRISEAVDLKWSDVDFDKEAIRLLDESLRSGGSKERRTLKNHRSRSFPIHTELLPVLQRLRRREGYVFSGPRGGRLKPDTVRNIFIRDVLTPLKDRFPVDGDEGRGFITGRLHSFRHFFCSLCSNNDVAERAVMEWLGHADAIMVRRYYHLRHDEARRQMRKVTLSVKPDADVGTGRSSPPSGGSTAAG